MRDADAIADMTAGKVGPIPGHTDLDGNQADGQSRSCCCALYA